MAIAEGGTDLPAPWIVGQVASWVAVPARVSSVGALVPGRAVHAGSLARQIRRPDLPSPGS